MKLISDNIISLENENNLWTWEVQEVYIWELIRLDIYLMAQEVGLSEKFVPKIETKNIARTRIKRILKNIYRTPFFGKSKELVFESARKYKIEGNKYVDLYTYFLNNSESLINPLFIETTLDYENFDYNKKHIDSLSLLSGIIQKFISINFKEEEISSMKLIELLLIKKLGIEINLVSFVKNKIVQFKAEKFVYNFLLKSQNPEKVFFIGYNRFSALVAACKSLGIESVEIQHGLILKESLIYHFPNAKKNQLNYFPDKFIMWANFPYNTGELPISRDNISLSTENHLNHMMNYFRNLEKEDKTILIISQPLHSSSLFNFLLNNLKDLKSFKILYKLHPMEFHMEGLIEKLSQLDEFENVKVIRNEFSVYELLKRSKYVLGIYSTTLFEAVFFECKVFVLDIEENLYAESLRKNPSVGFLKVEESIVNYL